MLKKIKMLIAAAVMAGMFAVPVLSTGTVFAADSDIQNNLCSGTDLSLSGSSVECDASSTSDLDKIIKTIVNIFTIIVGIIAVFMIIIGGFKYITSGGESSSVSGAKNTILYAIVGLVIVALAQVIVRFVLAKV